MELDMYYHLFINIGTILQENIYDILMSSAWCSV